MNKRFLFLCWLMVSITISADEYVDLGLPSGLKWATCNIDAQSPTDYGGYYAFGEIVGSTEGQKNLAYRSKSRIKSL